MLLEGKKGLIIGVANKHSIAWAIAQAAAREGAQMLFSYQNERLRENVEELVQTLPGASACVCDVGDDSQIDAMMKQASEKLGRLDFLVHSLAFAPREELTGEFVNTTRQGFATALDVSAYSLVAVTRAAMPLMTEGGSVDLVWINGANFLSMKQQGLLYGPFLDRLPNARYLDLSPGAAATVDFTIPTEGYEAPWRLAKFVLFHDSARVPEPPRTMATLLEWAKPVMPRL